MSSDNDRVDFRVVELTQSLEPLKPLKIESSEEETVVVVLSGKCSATFEGGPRWDGLGGRNDVWDGKATAFYVPVGATCEVTAETDSAHVAVIAASASTVREPYLVTPDDISVQHRGRDSWQREVHDIISPEHPADRLLVGETFNGAGVWSSYPPHKHDHHNPPVESKQVESFLVRVEPTSGFGVFVHYPDSAGERNASIVTDGEIVNVERGFHSFVAAGGHKFYYLWALAGQERVLCFHTDERDAWLLDETN